jgi:ATPase subunit of ABC transporter with duplicated ATPase domains
VAPGWKLRVLLAQALFSNPDILLLDEPTNHMDMESIESLNIALDKYEGTLIFVSHDREFVSSLATRVLEVKENEVVDFRGTYEEYLTSQGID